MNTCTECHASLSACEVSMHKRRFHTTAPSFACGVCQWATLYFADALVHGLLHGHSSTSLKFVGKKAGNNCGFTVKQDMRQPSNEISRQVHSFDILPEETETSVFPRPKEPEVSVFIRPEETFHEIPESTTHITWTSPTVASESEFDNAPNSLVSQDEECETDAESINSHQNHIRERSPRQSQDPTCAQCHKTINAQKRTPSGIVGVRVQHVIHCERITPFVCTGCSATFGRRFCVERHARRHSQCSSAKAVLRNQVEDELRIRNGLNKCFPTLNIPWIGLR